MSLPTAPSLLPDIDRAVFAAAFVASLRRAGLVVSTHSAERLAAALGAVRPTARTELYWVARVCLVGDVRDVEVFNRVFDVVFEGGALPTGRDARKSQSLISAPPPNEFHHRINPRGDAPESEGGVPWSSSPSAALHDRDDPADDLALPELLPSGLAQLADVPFDRLNEVELTLIGEWLEQAVVRWPTRRVRRTRRSKSSGPLDQRATLARARGTGGDPADLIHRRRIDRPRKVVMVADVSGSMQTFVRPYMHVMRSLTTLADAEVFAISTRATRITPALRQQDPVDAITAASELVDDRFAGTRLATSLSQLMHHPTWSTHLRGAVALIASDGLDTDPPADLARHMQRLERMTNRIVWVNPRAAADEFEPLVGGMAAALPHCTTMLSGHSLRAIREVLSAVGSR